jgi:thymidylate synthase
MNDRISSNIEELEFLKSLKNVIENGFRVPDRTGTGVKFLPGICLKYDLSNNKIPIWTTRKINWKNQWLELIWFLRGDTDVKWLEERGVNIWSFWKKSDGTIGPGYGKQWRNIDNPNTARLFYDSTEEEEYIRFDKIDQFQNLINGITKDPYSKRHVITLWNPSEVKECSLPPCHSIALQFLLDENKGLHCLQFQRSADLAIGYCPWQYTMLTHIIGKLTNTIPTSFTATLGSAHVYLNQLDAIKTQLNRTPTNSPEIKILKNIQNIKDVEDLTIDDVEILNYNFQPFIKFPVSI